MHNPLCNHVLVIVIDDGAIFINTEECCFLVEEGKLVSTQKKIIVTLMTLPYMIVPCIFLR